jgi:hypothetical protein
VKKSFNNPIFVGVLALVALGVLFGNVVGPALDSFSDGNVGDALNSFVGGTDEGGSGPVRGGEIDLAALGWVDEPQRDPFRPYAPRETLGEEERIPFAAEVLAVAATLVEPGYKAASINGVTVAVGDRVMNYKVVAIEPGTVWVEGPRGKESINVGAGKRPNR